MTKYEQMGIAAMLPGMVHMLTLMQAEIDRMRSYLALAQESESDDNVRSYISAPPVRKGGVSPEGAERRRKAVVGYWASQTPEERSIEVKRRQRLGEKKKQRASEGKTDLDRLHPRDPRSPRHAAWAKKMRAANLKTWASYTPEERAERVAKARHPRRAA